MQAAPAAVAETPVLSELEAAAAADRESFRRSLESAAQDAEQQSPPLKAQAALARGWIPQEAPDRIVFYREPRESAESAPTGSPAEIAWTKRFFDLRRAYAARTWERAKQAAQAKAASQAEAWMLEALRNDPDHAAIREVLGQTLYRGAWIGEWEAKQAAAGRVRHPKFGWLRSTHVAPYEQGKRFWQGPTGANAKGEWIGADEEKRLRSMHGLPWETETEHYKVKSYVSLERAVEFATRLEELHEAWSHLFLRFWATTPKAEDLFTKPRQFPAKHPHKVVHFASKEQYVRELAKAAAGDISISTGIYFSENETAYFYDGTEYDAITLLHEGTHQLFSEVNPRVRAVGRRDGFWEKRRANFWVVEAIACFMESLKVEPGRFLLGGFDSDRFQAARLRALERKEYTPLAKLTQYGMLSLLRDPQIAALYSQSLGEATFFMQGGDGKYREGFFDYLQLVYLGQDQPQSLSRALDAPFERLDDAYHDFLRAAPERAP